MFIKHLQTVNSNFVFKKFLFGAIKITNTTNSDTDKWQYSGYGIGFDSKGEFIHPNVGYGNNLIIFGVDLSNSRHANNKTKRFNPWKRPCTKNKQYNNLCRKNVFT